MSWNYRIMHHKEGDEDYLEIHEVYYNKAGQVTRWTTNPAKPYAESKSGLVWVLNRMKEATKKPTLEYDMQPEGEDDKPEE
jgi:hypothetical protein